MSGGDPIPTKAQTLWYGEDLSFAHGDYYLPSRLLGKQKGEVTVFTLYVMSQGKQHKDMIAVHAKNL